MVHEHDMRRAGMAGIRQEALSLEEPSMRPVRMLIIDDEPSFVSALARLLSHDGTTVDTAANGSLALTQLQTHRYDVVLCDLRMPTLDGPDFYATLLQQHAYLCQRMIFLTGGYLRGSQRGVSCPSVCVFPRRSPRSCLSSRCSA